MDNGSDVQRVSKYAALISMINELEKRLYRSDLVYLTLNILIVFFVMGLISLYSFLSFESLLTIHIFFMLACLVIGMAVCVYWAASATRLHLKLKLRYFQARFLEREMNCPGEFILSDESLFFDRNIKDLESHDKKEVLSYPVSGFMRMDGFMGSIKARHFSWFMPLLFFVAYWVIFIWTVITTTS